MVEKTRTYYREKARVRAKTDIIWLIRKRLRGRMIGALKRGTARAGGTVELLGCSITQLKAHIESLWLPGMTWENHSLRGWHIDHKRPCASFDLTDTEQQKACFNYTNLQPLWWHDNLKKGHSI